MEDNDLHPEYKQNPFTVPEGYFENFDNKVMDKIYRNNARPTMRVSYVKWLVAAGVALVAGIGVVLYNSGKSSGINLADETVDSMELVAYANETDINEEEFVEMVDETAVDSIYREEVILKVNAVNYSESEQLESLQEEYTPLEDEIEI